MNPNRASEQTRTAETIKSYLLRAESLLNRIATEMTLPEDAYPPPDAVVDYLIRHSGSWKWSTFRQRQANLACRYDIEYEKTGDPVLKDAADRIRKLPHAQCLPESTPGRTSSRKRKGIPEKDFNLLIANLANPKLGSQYARCSALWLMATLATGLRPCEWEQARLDPERGELVVVNAKATNGRGNGSTRILPVDPEDVPVVEAFLRTIREMIANGPSGHAIDYALLQKSCGVAVNRACKALWGGNPMKRYALYSARHQYLANLKAVVSKQEVAARAGHSSERTARRHYAPKRSAWQRYKDAAKMVLQSVPSQSQK